MQIRLDFSRIYLQDRREIVKKRTNEELPYGLDYIRYSIFVIISVEIIIIIIIIIS